MAKSVSKSRPKPPRICVIVSRYNESITAALLAGAIKAHRDRYGSDPTVADAPGAFELTVLAATAATSREFDAIVCLGCVIRGDTDHDRYICDAVSRGLTEIAIGTGVPVAFGVLTVDNVKQAKERAGGKHGNKGEEAMVAAIEAFMSATCIRAGRGYSMGAKVNDKSERRA